MPAEAGIAHPVASYANALPSLGKRGEESELRAAGDAHPCVSSETKVKPSRRARLGSEFSADLPADLRVDLPHESIGSCTFLRVPESVAASLHLHHRHSTSSHLLRGNERAVTAHRCTYTETSANSWESSWPHRESCQEEMPPAQTCSVPSRHPHKPRHNPEHHLPETLPRRVTLAALLLAVPPRPQFGNSSWKPKQTQSQSCGEGSSR